MIDSEFNAVLEAQSERRALARAFYADEGIYERDVEQIFMRSWLYAGHVSEIPETGDWFLYELDRESVIIMRDAEDSIHALVNVCRHRGSRICLEARGNSKRLACRYHGWVYGLDGALLAAREMDPDFDYAAHSLRKIHCEVLAGMIFINFAEHPGDFGPVREGLGPRLEPYRLEEAKVAHRQDYPMQANWKLAVENYTECYHCAPAHPEYSRGHGLAHAKNRLEQGYDRIYEEAPDCGLSDSEINRIYGAALSFGSDFAYERYPLIRGHVTGSEDGQAVAPLLGDISGYYGGCADFQVGPVTFALAYCDYVVIYAFRPLGKGRSTCDITWLVRGDAEEGRDYDRERVTWLWDVTTQADKQIIENNAAGVNSRFYTPGPYSNMESFTWKFVHWYLQTMRASE